MLDDYTNAMRGLAHLERRIESERLTAVVIQDGIEIPVALLKMTYDAYLKDMRQKLIEAGIAME